MIFLLTTRAAGKGFIEKMTRLVNYWTDKCIDNYGWFITSRNFLEFKIKKNSETLKRRLSRWKHEQLQSCAKYIGNLLNFTENLDLK